MLMFNKKKKLSKNNTQLWGSQCINLLSQFGEGNRWVILWGVFKCLCVCKGNVWRCECCPHLWPPWSFTGRNVSVGSRRTSPWSCRSRGRGFLSVDRGTALDGWCSSRGRSWCSGTTSWTGRCLKHGGWTGWHVVLGRSHAKAFFDSAQLDLCFATFLMLAFHFLRLAAL